MDPTTRSIGREALCTMSTAQIYAALGLPKDVRGDEDHRETCRTLDEALNPPDEFEVTE